MEVTFITATYNGLRYTKEFWSSFQRTIPNFLRYEYIFVDDCSTDGVQLFLRELAELNDNVTLVENPSNQGFAKNNNLAARKAKGEYLFFLNNDLLLEKNWFEPIFKFLKNNYKHCGLVGNVQYRMKDHSIDHHQVLFDRYGLPCNVANLHCHKKNEICQVIAVTAACCAIEKSKFLEVNGFDELFINGFEDIDLCLRLNSLGYRSHTVLDSIVGHHVSPSLGRKKHDITNAYNFLKRWRHITAEWGIKFWPLYYVRKYLSSPWRYNGPKLIDAALRILGLRKGVSPLAEKKFITLEQLVLKK